MPSPKDTGGPLNTTGPNKGKVRHRTDKGRWHKKRSDTGKQRK